MRNYRIVSTVRNTLQSFMEDANEQEVHPSQEQRGLAQGNSQGGTNMARKCRKNTKASIKFAALNIKGNGHICRSTE
jgi:hypothetical protein